VSDTPARVSWQRVVLGAALLAGIATAALTLLHEPPAAIAGADTRRTPAFDISDDSTRRALRFLVGEEGDWLGWRCGEGSANVYRVATQPGYSPEFREREVWVRPAGNFAELTYRVRPFLSQQTWDTHTTRLDGTGLAEFESILAKAGYYRDLPITDGSLGCMDGGQDVIESCLDQRYFGVIRTCRVDRARQLADEVMVFARRKTAVAEPDPRGR
jgi:hypothetical protein